MPQVLQTEEMLAQVEAAQAELRLGYESLVAARAQLGRALFIKWTPGEARDEQSVYRSNSLYAAASDADELILALITFLQRNF